MADLRLAVLDTSVVVDPLEDYAEVADVVCVSAVTIGELAFGLHGPDPLVNAERELRYREILADFTPVPYDQDVAHWYGSMAAAVRNTGRNPRSRTADLQIAATARHLGAAVLTRNLDDFKGLERIVRIVAV